MTGRNFTDAELVAATARLRTYAIKLTRNAIAADDLLQETVLRALEKQHLFQPGTNLYAWMGTIMHSLHVNELRRYWKAGPMAPLESVPEPEGMPHAGDARLQCGEALAAYRALPADMRAVATLAFSGLGANGIAAGLRIPVGTAKSRLYRALRKLARAVA